MNSCERSSRITSPGPQATTHNLARSLASLLKLKVVGLLVFAAIGGAFMGASGWPGLWPLVVLIVTGVLAASGASAINEYLEREPDAHMERTRERPIVTGAIPPTAWVCILGSAMIACPALVALPYRPALTFFLVLGAIIYVGIYTLWLKPRTAWNVIIGGLAGSCAVLSGGAAVGPWGDPGVIALAALVFFWSPTHFWSLAQACRNDYVRARVPMLPVVTTPRWAAFWGFLHALASAITGLLLGLHPTLGQPYLLLAVPPTGFMLVPALLLLAQPKARHAWWLFHASNIYLGLIFLAVCLVSTLH